MEKTPVGNDGKTGARWCNKTVPGHRELKSRRLCSPTMRSTVMGVHLRCCGGQLRGLLTRGAQGPSLRGQGKVVSCRVSQHGDLETGTSILGND